MASVNRIVIVGNLGANPEMRLLPSGDAVANFTVATTDRRSDSQGGYRDATEWHRVALYGRQAEVARKYLRKGSQVYVEGKLRSSVWIDRSGIERRTWSVIADRMQMLGKPEHAAPIAAERAGDDMGWMDSPAPNAMTKKEAIDSNQGADRDIPF